MARANNSKRPYYVLFPQHPLIRVWTLETVILDGLHKRLKRCGRTPADITDRAKLTHNVVAAEFEFVHWLAVNKYSEKYLKNERLFGQMISACQDHTFATIDRVIKILMQFASTLPFSEQALTDDVLSLRDIEENRIIVFSSYRKEALGLLGNPKRWGNRQIDEYYDWFPEDEFLIPCQWAINAMRKEAVALWGIDEVLVFGYPDGDLGYNVLESASNILEGESWKDALRRDPDDLEPWQKK